MNLAKISKKYLERNSTEGRTGILAEPRGNECNDKKDTFNVSDRAVAKAHQRIQVAVLECIDLLKK